MMKKVGLLVSVVCLLLVFLCPLPVQAREGITVMDSYTEAEYPLSLKFGLSAASDVDITDIRLHYTVDRMSHADVTSEVYIEFMPATGVDVEWDWDMRKVGGLPPGSIVEYWWTVTDAQDDVIETEPDTVYFEDTRYSWQSLAEGKVTLYWYRGNETFADEVMSTVQEALERLANDTGAEPERPINIYLYENSRDLQGAMIYPQEWTGGVAFTAYSTIAIGMSSSKLEWGKRAIAHELTHLVIHQMVFNPYNNLPTWLDEGLAVYNEGPMDGIFADVLNKAINEDELITVRSLSSPFSAFADEATLAYAQSCSLVEFLIGNYGQDKMLELLNTFREGNTYDWALQSVYGFDMDGLNILWLGAVSGKLPSA